MEPVGALEGPVEYTLTLSLPSVHWTCCLHTSPCATNPYPPHPPSTAGTPLFLLSGAYLMQVSPCALLLLRPKGNRAALPRSLAL